MPQANDRKLYYVDACAECAWHLQIWRKDGDGEIMHIPYRCRSWRHEGDCRLWRGAQDFVRIQEGMEKEENWSHLNLTYDPKGLKLNAELFRSGLRSWSMLRKRIIRSYGRLRYIQTWEIHRSGWPHIHVAISNAKLHAIKKEKDGWNFTQYVAEHAVACGFGYVGWLDPLRSKDAMAGYLVKLARELTGTGKDYQIPVNAPKNFRRLRSSAHLLPPPHKDPDLTGILRFCKIGTL